MHFIALFFLWILMIRNTNGNTCSLKDLDVRPNSTYVIYGVTDSGIFFNFSNDDVRTSGLSPDALFSNYLNPPNYRQEDDIDFEDHRLEIIYTENDGILYRILRKRYHFKNDADHDGIPHYTEFLYRGDRRSQINSSKTVIMFTVADTERMRYHVKHNDELGLHGGFPLWQFLRIFKITGRMMFNMELRFKIIERPQGYRYTDESRLWNTGADLILNDGVENLGKEWQYAFATVKERQACIVSKGLHNVDLHLLWRHNRRLRDVYRNMEMNVLKVTQGFPLGPVVKDDEAVVVAVRGGVLFMCPMKEKISTLEEMYNIAGFYARNNPSLKEWQNWDEGKIFLVSQHFKEVIVILANAAGLFYKAFRTSSDRFRAFTLRLNDFEWIPNLALHSEGRVLKAVDLYHDTLYFYYEDETWKVALSGINTMKPIKEEDSPRLITDTFTGRREPPRMESQVQLFNGIATALEENAVGYGRSKGSSSLYFISENFYDAVLILRRTLRVDPSRSRGGFYFGMKDCVIFVSFLRNDSISKLDSGETCAEGREMRMFFAHSHLIVVSYFPEDNTLRYYTRKVEFEEDEDIWTSSIDITHLYNNAHEFRPEIHGNPDLCYVRGYKLYCVLRIKENDNRECIVTIGVLNWLTNTTEPSRNFSIFKFYGGNWKLQFEETAVNKSFSDHCENIPDFFLLKDNKDLLMRLSDSNVYLCQNEHLQNNSVIPCFNTTIEEWENPRLISWTTSLVTWMIKDPPEFIVCEANTSRIFARHKDFVFLGTTVENIDIRSRGAELFQKYTNAPKYNDEPPPAEEIRLPKGDELKKAENLWDMQCPAWQKTATLILCIIEALELLAFGGVLIVVQFIAKPKLRKYRIQKGVGITKRKRDMKKRAIRRLKKLRLQRLRRRRRLARRVAAEINHSSYSNSSGSSSSEKSSDGCKSESTKTDLRSFTTQTRGEDASQTRRMKQAKDADPIQEPDLKHEDRSVKSSYFSRSSNMKG